MKKNNKQRKNQKKQRFDSLVKVSKKILITTHIDPDFDAISSCLGIFSYLKSNFSKKDIGMVISGNISSDLIIFPDLKNIESNTDIYKHLEGVDLVVFVDGPTVDRFTYKEKNVDLSSFNSICIDHHPGERDEFTLDLSDSRAAATAQIITDLFFETKKQISKKMAETLLLGIMGDTGNLRYIRADNCSVLSTTKKLIDAGGIDLQSLQLKYESMTLEELAVLKELAKNIVMVKTNAFPYFMYSYLPESFSKNLEAGSINIGARFYHSFISRRIVKYPWGFLVKKNGDHYQISFRSSPGSVDVGQLAKDYFSGGGHSLASGGEYITKTKDVKKACEEISKIIKTAKIWLDSGRIL